MYINLRSNIPCTKTHLVLVPSNEMPKKSACNHLITENVTVNLFIYINLFNNIIFNNIITNYFIHCMTLHVTIYLHA